MILILILNTFTFQLAITTFSLSVSFQVAERVAAERDRGAGHRTQDADDRAGEAKSRELAGGPSNRAPAGGITVRGGGVASEVDSTGGRRRKCN